MECSSSRRDDGLTEIRIILSDEELKKISSLNKPVDNLLGQAASIFSTTQYCVTCTLNNEKHDIDVPFGDAGANIKATAICGPGLYRYHEGPCP